LGGCFLAVLPWQKNEELPVSIYSDFERKELDKYYTPYEAVIPLLPHLPRCTEFIEPCAGDGRLIRHLESAGHRCLYACDIKPEGEGIEQRDVLFFDAPLPPCRMVISNTPWNRKVLHPMIDLFRNHADSWLLFDAGWMFTAQAKPYLTFCNKIVTVGRISWEGNGISGTEDCAWYLFTKEKIQTLFFGK